MLVLCCDGQVELPDDFIPHSNILSEVNKDSASVSLEKYHSASLRCLVTYQHAEGETYLEVMELLVYLEVAGRPLAHWIKTLPCDYHKKLPRHVLVYLWQSASSGRCDALPDSLPHVDWSEYKYLASLLCLDDQMLNYQLFLRYLLEVHGLMLAIDEPAFLITVNDYGVLPPTLSLSTLTACDDRVIRDMLKSYRCCSYRPSPYTTAAVFCCWVRVADDHELPKLSADAHYTIASYVEKLVRFLGDRIGGLPISTSHAIDAARRHLTAQQARGLELYFKYNPRSCPEMLWRLYYESEQDCVCCKKCTIL